MQRVSGGALFPYTTLFRSPGGAAAEAGAAGAADPGDGDIAGSQHGTAGNGAGRTGDGGHDGVRDHDMTAAPRSEEHTSELQSRGHLVCRLLLEKKKQEI